MSELDSLQEAVEACHGAKAAFLEQTPIREVFRRQIVWEGSVFTFALEDHPTARCYALRVDGKITTVLHEPPIDSPVAAVRAAIVTNSRE